MLISRAAAPSAPPLSSSGAACSCSQFLNPKINSKRFQFIFFFPLSGLCEHLRKLFVDVTAVWSSPTHISLILLSGWNEQISTAMSARRRRRRSPARPPWSRLETSAHCFCWAPPLDFSIGFAICRASFCWMAVWWGAGGVVCSL